MKTKLQKRQEALARLEANIDRTTKSLVKYRQQSKQWKRPVLTAQSTPDERRYFMLLPQENPFLKLIELSERHLSQMERHRQLLRDKIATTNRQSYA